MRYPEPILTTETAGDAMRVAARYETPETARMMMSLRTLTAGLSFVGLAATALWLINRSNMSNQIWLLSVIVTIIGAFGLGQGIADASYRRRFFSRRITDATLQVELSRTKVTHHSLAYIRGGVLRFTAQPHRAGRHEERDERIKERLLPMIYREAFQVWLQHGEDFALLANVSDEHGATAIVRRLQEKDEQVGRGGARANELTAFGDRQTPN